MKRVIAFILSANSSAALGSTKTLEVTPAGGSGNYTYTWQVYFLQNRKWSDIMEGPGDSKYIWITDGDTNAVKINFIKDWYFDNYKFRCKVSDGKTEVYTNEIQISKKS